VKINLVLKLLIQTIFIIYLTIFRFINRVSQLLILNDIASYLFLGLNIKNKNSVPLLLLNDDHYKIIIINNYYIKYN